MIEKQRATLGVDIDNVLSLTDPAIRQVISDFYGINLRQEDIVHFDYHRCGISLEQEKKVLEVFDDITCADLPLMPGAVGALSVLRQRYRIILVTSRNPKTREKTENWIQLNGIPHDALFFEKVKQKTEIRFDFFVEDNGESALQLAKKGIKVFLFDYPWNRYIKSHPNITRVFGWHDIVACLT